MALFRKRRDALRPPVADLDAAEVSAEGRTLALRQAVVGARVDGGRLQVEVHHPVFADLPDESRLRAAEEIMVATLGEQGLRQSVGELRAVAYQPIDSFGLDPLRSFVRSLGVSIEPPTADPPA